MLTMPQAIDSEVPDPGGVDVVAAPWVSITDCVAHGCVTVTETGSRIP